MRDSRKQQSAAGSVVTLMEEYFKWFFSLKAELGVSCMHVL